MKTVVIVQARMGSTRLPGKVLEPLGGASALKRCLDRCFEIPKVDEVVCAVPEGRADSAVADEAARAGAGVVRGDQDDVLARYAKAARETSADVVVRVTSDCPFVDPQLCREVVALLVAARADYACNNMPPLFPHGLDCEAMWAEQLFEAERLALASHEREHVTPWLRENRELRRAALAGPGEGVERLRWTLDYPEDLAFARAIYAALGEKEAATVDWRTLARFCALHPDLAAVNAVKVDEDRLVKRPDPDGGLRIVEAA